MTTSASATERLRRLAQDRTRKIQAAAGSPKPEHLSEHELRTLVGLYGSLSAQADVARAELQRRGLI